jgi:hypothetical protein
MKQLNVEIKPVPVPNEDHPPPFNDVLPKHEFTMGLIAPKGAGKTTVICNLLKFYKKYFHSIVIFSPTVENDEKWNWVKNQDLLLENLPLKKFIKQLKIKDGHENNQIVKGPMKHHAFDGLVDPIAPNFDARIPEECFHHVYTEDDLAAVLDEQNMIISLLKKFGKSKYLANRMLLIFDDLVGSDLFNNRKKNVFKGIKKLNKGSIQDTGILAQVY